MTTIELTQEADSDKMLRLTIPVAEAHQRYRMVIVIVPESEAEDASATAKNEWPEGYFERTYGSIQDDSFQRQPQGDYEKRLEFE